MPRLVRLITSAFVFATGPAFGVPITLDGITLDAGSTFNRTIYHNPVSQVGDVLSGYGEVLQIFGPSGTTWTAGSAGYHLSYVFSGFVVSDISQSYIGFMGGEVRFFVQNESQPGYSALTPTPPGGANIGADIANDFVEAGDGTLWLSTIGNTFNDAVSGKPVTLRSNGIGNDGFTLAGSIGLLDITGGSAAAYFQKDTIADSHGSAADLQFGSSFSNLSPLSIQDLSGSADLRGIAIAQIPEPPPLILLGAGFLAWGVRRRISCRPLAA